jgi:hypothetical protein
MKVLIVAAGEGVRWENYRNVPKHIVEVEGEILLHRTYAQFKRYTDNIVIVSTDPRYAIGQTYAPLVGDFLDFGKMYSSYPIWDDERTVIVFGDVYFTDKAVETIMSNTDDFKFFLRKDKSSYTGKNHKEIFALAFNGGMNQKIKSCIETLIEKKVGAPGSIFIRGGLNISSNQPSSQTLFPFYQTIFSWIIPNISPFVKYKNI